MKFYAELDTNVDIKKFEDLYNKHFVEDYNYAGVPCCNTLKRDEYAYINDIVKKIGTILNCNYIRCCYVLQKNINDNLPPHIDLDDANTNQKYHADYYSIIFPITGAASTNFHELHKEDLGPSLTHHEQRYKYYLHSDASIIDSIIVTKPTVLENKYPHSVKMISAPRVTYHIKIYDCYHSLSDIKNKLDAKL